MLSTCVAKFVPKLSCLQDLKLDKLQHFVLDECDKCLDKVDMRKDRTQSAVASLHPQDSRETLAGCPANLYGFAQEEAGLQVKKVSLHWCCWSYGRLASDGSAAAR